MTNNTKDTIVAFIRTGCALAAMIAAAFGVDLDAELINNVAVIFAAAVIIGWGCWKDNNFTRAATDAHDFVKLFKANKADRRDKEEAKG